MPKPYPWHFSPKLGNFRRDTDSLANVAATDAGATRGVIARHGSVNISLLIVKSVESACGKPIKPPNLLQINLEFSLQSGSPILGYVQVSTKQICEGEMVLNNHLRQTLSTD
ncbi:unnamed protein product [Pieris brassicae]|uniref:Uncharacterized protein n=1 Tax=Pieris brassicae TaxID=7116 RepID=A0A9P0XA05_PIEBR|nr:unnamed protein product [Pieris brassicae]